MKFWNTLSTPCLILDRNRLQKNIERMSARVQALGISLRPHVKTPKSIPVVRALEAAGARGFTVSTLKEAEYLSAAGVKDLFLAVPADGAKARRALPLMRGGATLSMLVDGLEAARQIGDVASSEGVVIPIWIEIDVDHYRTGISLADPDFDVLVDLIGSHPSLSLAGIMSYGGASYGIVANPSAVADLTERHRQALFEAADRVEQSGFPRPRLSFGSTPATLHARTLEGVDEARCGIYVFQDLFQAGIGACRISDIALSVLTTVIGQNPSLGRFTIDAGALALSKDRSTQGHSFDAGFGLVCNAETGEPIGDLQVTGVSQELGLVSSPSGAPIDFGAFPVGSRVRILPNHADMTAAAYEEYHLIDEGGLSDTWERTNRW
jgi:D-serine deaminase-like pyridoxal phosphate-dependent protein